MTTQTNTQRAENPIKRFRKACDVTRNQFAWAIGLGYTQVANAELGQHKTIPQSWRPGLERLGIDFDKLNGEYIAWREQQGMQIPQLAQHADETT